MRKREREEVVEEYKKGNSKGVVRDSSICGKKEHPMVTKVSRLRPLVLLGRKDNPMTCLGGYKKEEEV